MPPPTSPRGKGCSRRSAAHSGRALDPHAWSRIAYWVRPATAHLRLLLPVFLGHSAPYSAFLHPTNQHPHPECQQPRATLSATYAAIRQSASQGFEITDLVNQLILDQMARGLSDEFM